ncbi:hypothetical protein LZ189_00480 [Rhodovulum sulfidophilum]|nr:hypothetical protein [Rhodovulum sulfidophilum]
MEQGFYHPERGYWQTIGTPSAEIIATYPEGTIDVPLRPGPDHALVDGAWVPVEQDPAERLAAWRASATLSRLELASALIAAGILTQGEAEDLAAQRMPGALAALVEPLPEDARSAVRLRLVGLAGFARADPIWDALLGPELADAVFGRQDGE